MKVNRAIPPQGKVVYYRSDGTGRDTYIRESNGGLLSKDRIYFLKTFKPQKQRNFTLGTSQYNRHPSNYKSSKSNKFPHYISDGSGRDFYVTSNQGGNSNLYRWRDRTDFLFKSSLRNHNPFKNSNPQKQDLFTKSQMKSSWKQQSFRRTFGPIQRQLDNRLSQPKRSLIPPPINSYFQQKFNAPHMNKMCELEQTHFKKRFSLTNQCIHKKY